MRPPSAEDFRPEGETTEEIGRGSCDEKEVYRSSRVGEPVLLPLAVPAIAKRIFGTCEDGR